jgi:hypothetical protein
LYLEQNKERILFIASVNPFKRFGGGLATLAYYQAIKAIYDKQVDLILPKEAIGDNNCEENHFKVPRRNKLLALMASLFGDTHRFRKYVFIHLRKYPNRYRLCIINGSRCAGNMIAYIKSFNIKVIVIHHNYEKEYHLDNKTIETFYGKFLYYVLRNERNSYRMADLNFFLTQSDMNSLIENYGICKGSCRVIGTFEYESRTAPLIKEVKPPYRIVITGSMNHNQTVCGITDFYHNYYPIICKEYPDIKIIISGRNPAKTILSILEREKDRITIIANPENMENVISMGSIYCCPTNIGGGLKLRVMDGLRQGLPILVHKISSRGYDTFFDKPFFKIYSDAETFKDGLNSILKLYSENKIDHEQIQKDYNDYFGFDAGCKRFKSFLMSLEV